MLRLVQLEEIEGILLELPGLVRMQERRSTQFVPATSKWLTVLEGALMANRLPQAGEVATIRSGLTAAEQGLVPAGINFRGRPTRTRVLGAVASASLQRAAALAADLGREQRPRFSEAGSLARQMIVLAAHKGLIPARPAGMEQMEYLRGLRRAFAASPELENAVIRLEGLVGPQDALVLLDRALSADTVA